MTHSGDISRLHGAGLTVRQIATTLGLSTQGVHYHLKRLGLSPNPPVKKEASR